MGIGHGLQLKGLEGRLLGMAASSPESFEKLTALRLAAGAGLGETSFQITFALKLRWSVEHPFKGGGAGSLQAAPLPLPPFPISERPGQPALGLPLTEPYHSLPLSLLESLSHPAPDTLLAGPVVVWIRSPGSFLFEGWVAEREEEVSGAWC